MANKYSRLMIDRDKIEGWIFLWCESAFETDFTITNAENNQRIQYEIRNSKKLIKLHFIKCNDGTTSIVYKVGNNQNDSEALAEYIYNRVGTTSEPKSLKHGFSVSLTKADFDVVIDLLQTEYNVEVLESKYNNNEGTAEYFQYKLQGTHGDKLVIKYFVRTSRMQVQGKPLFLYHMMVDLLFDHVENPNDIVDAQVTYFDINIDLEQVDEDLKSFLGESLYGYLPATHHATLKSAYILINANIALPDYSLLIQPVLRVMEGFIQKTLNNNGVECKNSDDLKTCFSRDSKYEPFSLIRAVRNDDELEKKAIFESLYNHYKKWRDPYSHATGKDTDTKIIEDVEKARDILRTTINLMKDSLQILHG